MTNNDQNIQLRIENDDEIFVISNKDKNLCELDKGDNKEISQNKPKKHLRNKLMGKLVDYSSRMYIDPVKGGYVTSDMTEEVDRIKRITQIILHNYEKKITINDEIFL